MLVSVTSVVDFWRSEIDVYTHNVLYGGNFLNIKLHEFDMSYLILI